jgi:hypothetical protein
VRQRARPKLLLVGYQASARPFVLLAETRDMGLAVAVPRGLTLCDP